jgi:putative transcriptional regulator
MGIKKVRVADVCRATGLNRSTVSALYRENLTRIDLSAVNTLCEYFNCDIGELFEYVADE